MATKTKKQRSDAAKKAAATRKRNKSQKVRRTGTQGGSARRAATHVPAKSSRSKKGELHRAVSPHRFEPGSEVGVYEEHLVAIKRQQGDPPAGKPVATAKVAKDGGLEVTVPRTGQYVVVGEVGEGNWHYLSVGVN